MMDFPPEMLARQYSLGAGRFVTDRLFDKVFALEYPLKRRPNRPSEV